MSAGGAPIQINVEGLKQFRKDLKAVDIALPKELGKMYKQVGQTIVDKAKGRATGLGSTAAKFGPVALTATARATDVSIRLNGSTYPAVLGAEFGGSQPQFKPWRGNGADAGYFLYPTIRAESQAIIDGYLKAVDAATKLAFPNK